MKIEKIKIRNWRSIKDIELQAQDLMVVIGQNNHGKSNLLFAILFFFGEIKHQDLDFHFDYKELFVELKFGNLDGIEKEKFKKYLTSDQKMIVRKTAFLEAGFEYRGYIEIPTAEYLQEGNASKYTDRSAASNLPFYSLLPDSRKITKKNIIDAQTSYIAQNRKSITFNPLKRETTNFLGSKPVATGTFGEVYFIPAVREASDDFISKDSSVFGKMYANVVALMSEHDEDWKTTKEKLSELFSTLNKKDSEGNDNKDRPQQLSDFEEELADELGSWEARVNIEVSPPDIESVFKANTQVWIDDGARTDIKRKGHGLQRALTIALIRVVAKRATAAAKSGNGENEVVRKASNSIYFIVEEPELYLHPQSQRSLFESFVALSKSGRQVILSTHSSVLIDVERYRSIYIASKENNSNETKVRQCAEDLFAGDSNKDFNLSYWINPDRGELFFASKVILLEGATDKTAVLLLAKKLRVFKYEYTLIDCGSKDNIPLYVRLLNKFQIPYVAVYDRDHKECNSLNAIDAADASTRKIEKAINADIGCSIVFVNDIEEELGLCNKKDSKPYAALLHINSKEFSISKSMEEKIRSMYDDLS